MDKNEFWNNFLDYIKQKVDSISFNLWFKNSKLVKIDNRTIIIKVDSNYIKEHITLYYDDLMEEAINNFTTENYTYELVTKENEKIEEKVIVEENNDNIYNNYNSNLNSEYTFDNFVVGESNRLAATIGLSVAEEPGKLYNPLFIYGKSGIGKTHLMHAIGNHIKENSDKKVLYVPCETFINDFRRIYSNNDDKNILEEHFKDKYRNVDVLMVDDIQFLAGNKTQEEFWNTFNFLRVEKKQIIISSDRSPDDLKLLEDRLKTRFSWGLTVNITPPDYDLRLKILKNKITGHETSKLIEPQVLEYIANNCESDVRHLEGSINRLYAFITMYPDRIVNVEFAQEALKDYLGNSLYITNNIAKIQKAVAEYFDVTVENLKSKKRTSTITYARQIAMYLCKMTTEETIERIGLEFNRNHSTVIYSCDKINEDYNKNEEIRNQIKEIKTKISN